MVVHLVEHDLQAGRVQRPDHLAELAHAGGSVRVDRVRALGRLEVERVVAPVEAVEVADRLEARLLLGRGRAERREVARGGGLRGPVLLDRGDVERRQQVHRVDAGLGELLELGGARRLAGEGAVGAALGLGHGLVADREVAHVQLVDGPVDRALDDGRGRLGPLLGRDRRVVEVDDHRARRVRRERDRIRVGHRVRLDRPGRRRVDGERPAVLVAGGEAVDAPRAVGGVERGVDHLGVAGSAGAPALERDRLRGRRPEREARDVAVPGDAERHGCHCLGIEVVEHTRHLDSGERRQRVARALRDRELLGEQLLHRRAIDVDRVQRDEALELRELRELRIAEPCGVVGELDGVVATGHRTLAHRERRVGRVLERPRGIGRLGAAEQLDRPGQRVFTHPVRTRLARAGERRVGDDDLEHVRRERVAELDELARGRGERVVRPAGCAADAVVLVP